MHCIRSILAGFALLSSSMAACAPLPLAPATSTPQTPGTEEPLLEPTRAAPSLAPIRTPTRPTGMMGNDDLPAAVESALAAFSRSLDASLSEVELISYEEVTWPDSCLGLGGPDEMCLQALTPGYRIVLEVDGRTYEVHTDAQGASIRMKSAPGSQGVLPGVNQPIPVLAALRSLSEITGVPVEQIQIVSAEEVEWPDSCLGLAGPQEVCAEVITPGYQILLSAAGQEYEFHTDSTGENIRRK
jgi:hypothetical protein